MPAKCQITVISVCFRCRVLWGWGHCRQGVRWVVLPPTSTPPSPPLPSKQSQNPGGTNLSPPPSQRPPSTLPITQYRSRAPADGQKCQSDRREMVGCLADLPSNSQLHHRELWAAKIAEQMYQPIKLLPPSSKHLLHPSHHHPRHSPKTTNS